MPVPYSRESIAKLAEALRWEQHLGEVRGDDLISRLAKRDYPRQNPMDDVVMQAAVQQLAGPGIEIDPAAARYRPEHSGLNIHGFRVPAGISDEDLAAESRGYRYADTENNKWRQIPLERGTINALGPENNNPALWAHEYRHSAVPYERVNRYLDAERALTPKQWARALEMWTDMTGEGEAELKKRVGRK